MALPKRKVSKSRRDKRRTHQNAPAITVSVCPQCKKPIMPHTVCKNCGYYKGVKVLDMGDETKSKKEKAQ